MMHLINRKKLMWYVGHFMYICIAILSKYICIINVPIIFFFLPTGLLEQRDIWHVFFLMGVCFSVEFVCEINPYHCSLESEKFTCKSPPPFIFLCSLSLCWGPECLWGGERWSVELACCLSHKYHYTNKHSKHNCPNMVKLTTEQIPESAPCICFASVGKYFWL